jgi:hypothetical protein
MNSAVHSAKMRPMAPTHRCPLVAAPLVPSTPYITDSTAIKHLSAAYAGIRGGMHFSANTPSFLPTRASISAGSEAGARTKVDKLHSADHSDLYSAAKDFVQNTQYADQVDKAIRGVKESHYRVSDEQSKRLSESMGSSFDTATSLRHEMMASFHAAESYRRIASEAEENATSINSNANQAFMAWLQKKPGLQHLGSIEKLMTHEPEKAQAYAKRFAEEEVSKTLQGFDPKINPSREEIKANFQKEASGLSNGNPIQEIKKANDKKIDQAAHDLVGHQINHQTAKEVDNLMHNHENKIRVTKANVDEESTIAKTEVDDHLNQ